MNENVKNLISWWKLRGKQQSDPFIKFFFFYVCFDAWITAESGEDADCKKIKWFLENDNCLKSEWLTLQSSVKPWLNSLKGRSPVEDMRPNHRGEEVCLNDIENFEEVIRFIYQIRCNLFHGSKNPMDSRDVNLVDFSGKILERWIKWAYLKC